MILHYYAICDPGKIRGENQDNVYCNGAYRRDIQDMQTFRSGGTLPCEALFAVADGMGGEANGATASWEAVRGLDSVNRNGGAEAVKRYLTVCNEAMCGMIRAQNGLPMGSTFAGLLIQGGTGHVVNIGDSRVYLARGGVMDQLSRDHTAVQSMIDLGILTRETARIHPERHRLSQHLGIPPEETIIEPYAISGLLQPKDLFCLCSDGLTDMVDDSSLAGMLLGPGTLQEKGDALLSSALRGGGNDNISIILVQIEDAQNE